MTARVSLVEAWIQQLNEPPGLGLVGWVKRRIS